MFFKKPYKKLLVAELILVLGSVFIFRSLWLLLDMIPELSTIPALVIMLIVGVGVSVPSLRYILRKG